MPTTRITPNGTPDFATGVLVGAGSITEAVSDNSDASYVTLALNGFIVEDFTSFALPVGAVPVYATNWVRAGSDGTGVVRFERNGSSSFDGGVGVVVTRWVNNTFSASSTGAPMTSQTDVDGYRLRITSLNASLVYVAECVVDITYALVPSATVIGPTGTIISTTPTVTWAHTPGADAPTGQTHYRVRVYNTATGVLAYDSGVGVGAATSQAVGTLPLNATYQAVVNTAQVTNGVAQWSADATSTFNINVNAPTCVVTAPTGVLGTTSPTVTWTHTPGTGAQTGQTYYRIRAFDVANLATPVSDTGAVAGAATSAVIGPLDPAKSWRVVVNTAQTTSGVVQWSPDAATNFTINVSPPLISSVVATPSNPTASITGVVTLDGNGPLWETYDVQSSYDGGTTWLPVRGYTGKVAPFSAPVVRFTEPFNNLTAWTLGSGGTITAGGKVGNFLRMSGPDQERGYPIPEASRAVDVDVSFWWRTASVSTPVATLSLRSGPLAGNGELSVYMGSDGKLVLGVGQGGSPQLGVAATALAVNTWYRVRLVTHLASAASGSARVEVDGVSVINVSNVKTYLTTPMPTSIFVSSASGVLNVDYDELLFAITPPVPATFTDFEAPNDVPVQYRARASRTVSGSLVTGPWVLSTGDTGTGQFRTRGFQVFDPEGGVFRPKGLNVGTDMVAYYPPINAYTQGGAAMVVQTGHVADHSGDMATYGLNMIRLNIQDGLDPAVAIPRIQGVIDSYTAKKVVVLLDPHDEYGESPTIATWLASWAPLVLGPLLDANKTNPYVWVAPGNEEYHNGIEEAEWLSYHVGFYNWVRTTKTAPNTMIVADAMSYAQDLSHTATYANLIAGRTNQIIGWHNYGGDYQSADGQFHEGTPTDWNAWMLAAQTAGVPVQVHEFGQSWDPNDHGDHTYPGSDADERASVSWVLSNWDAYTVGGLAWHGTGANDNFNVRAVRAESFHGAWYDTNYPLSDWGATFFAKVTTSTVQWTNTTNETWVKDPAHPERSMKVCISQLPEATYNRTVGVFRPIGARFPVTVSDVLQAPVATVGVLTRSRAEETALLTLLAAPVLLVQSPNLPWSFGNRYVATGTITEGRTGPTSKTANRLWSIDLTEVDRPA